MRVTGVKFREKDPRAVSIHEEVDEKERNRKKEEQESKNGAARTRVNSLSDLVSIRCRSAFLIQ